MRSILTGGLIAAFVTIAMSASAGEAVQRSGGVFHKNVCHQTVAVGLAACHAHIVTDAAGKPMSSGRGERISGYGAPDLRDAYKITTTGNSSTIIAIVDAFGYDNAEADLAVYRAQYGLPACTTENGCFKKLNQHGRQEKYPEQNIGWAQESALDLDMASAMCPSCQIWLVESNDNKLRHLADAVDTAVRLGAHIVSNSYGGGDHATSSAYEGSYNHPGVAITVSSGDSGYGSQFPASSPHVTSVGGTRLVHASNDRGWAETAWTGAGSGCTKVDAYVKPEWQTDAKCKRRMIADVSAEADPGTGVAVYGPNNSGVSTWLRFGGTSVAAPIIGGIYGNNGGSVNYGENPYQHTDALFDVTSGSNGSCKDTKQYYCVAQVGYDGPTGLGTPNGNAAFGDSD